MSAVVVVAAVIEQDDAFLLTLRPDGTHLAGHWEFPGGKVHPARRMPRRCAASSSKSSTSSATSATLVHTITHAYPEKTVELFFYRCGFEGEPKPMMGQDMRWVPRAELARLPFPDADRALIAVLARRAPL